MTRKITEKFHFDKIAPLVFLIELLFDEESRRKLIPDWYQSYQNLEGAR